ncbi:hypothetical protein AB6A40_007859 [Gnathostoma spinigerum]|uniref:Uncharacterized protein n=1 Tax=Gnathostoma spinigerum TaxID=75299 RepID=A0ABD6EY26_9BILA
MKSELLKREIVRKMTRLSPNTKRLQVIHGDPEYKSFSQCNARPYTLFKSIFTNNTDRKQEYSFKTERSTESLCSVCREQGYSMGGETELTLKTPCKCFSP